MSKVGQRGLAGDQREEGRDSVGSAALSGAGGGRAATARVLMPTMANAGAGLPKRQRGRQSPRWFDGRGRGLIHRTPPAWKRFPRHLLTAGRVIVSGRGRGPFSPFPGSVEGRFHPGFRPRLVVVGHRSGPGGVLFLQDGFVGWAC